MKKRKKTPTLLLSHAGLLPENCKCLDHIIVCHFKAFFTLSFSFCDVLFCVHACSVLSNDIVLFFVERAQQRAESDGTTALRNLSKL